MNVFVTDLTVDNVVTHVQGFSSVIVIILLTNCVKCCPIFLPVTIHVLPYTFYTLYRTRFQLSSLVAVLCIYEYKLEMWLFFLNSVFHMKCPIQFPDTVC